MLYWLTAFRKHVYRNMEFDHINEICKFSYLAKKGKAIIGYSLFQDERLDDSFRFKTNVDLYC